MKNFLVSLFIKTKGKDQQGIRYVYGRMAGIVGVIVNVLICVMELVVGLLIGSIAMVSDAVHTVADAGGSLLTLISFKLSDAKPDAEHPYGHGRMEYLLSIGFSLILFVVAVQLGIESVHRIFNPEPVAFSFVSLAVMLGAMGLKFWLSSFLQAIGKDIDSPILVASGKESLSDVMDTASIAIGLVVGEYLDVNIDGYLGLFVAALIGWAGIRILLEGANRIMGYEPSKARVNEIKTFVKNYPGVLGVHDLLIHDYGPGHEYASIHVEVDANMSTMDSHNLLDSIERGMYRKLNIHLTTHMDPLVLDKVTQEWADRLNQIAKAFDEKAEVHDVRISERSDTDKQLDFMMTVPFCNQTTEADVRKVMVACIRAINPNMNVHMRYMKTN